MAKQSGLHQIRGKVGEHSYYRQTGISSGLIRSINQGMSERVKTAEEYANTRLNNQEFGAACNVAALLGKCVTPKFRPMILPFSQSKMAKDILAVAREHTENWGQRVVTSADTARLCEILSAQSKRDPSDFVSLGVTRSSASVAAASAGFNASQSTMMAGLGITALTVTAAQYDIATGQWAPLGEMMTTGYLERKDLVSVLENEEVASGSSYSSTEDLSVASFVPAANHAGHQIVVFVVMPARKINNVYHILQEYCSFVAMPLPAAA